MNIEQERADFEAWFTKAIAYVSDPKDIFAQIVRDTAWAAWQTRAALQSQDREDAARLDWLQQSDGRFFKLLHITSIVGRGFSPTNSSDKWFSSLRGAIDHARRVESKELK